MTASTTASSPGFVKHGGGGLPAAGVAPKDGNNEPSTATASNRRRTRNLPEATKWSLGRFSSGGGGSCLSQSRPLGDLLRVGAAGRTARVASHLHLGETSALRVER